MLEPQDRQTVLEALRPPEGYQLDFSIGTTFSLDLLTLLAVPLAFTRFQAEAEDGERNLDPTALLQALCGYAGKMLIFCHAGRIAVPARYNRMYVFLEDQVCEVLPSSITGSFHPKLWVLRFFLKGHPDTAIYRLLCPTRNLTNDRCWDTLLVLDGELRAEGAPQRRNEPLAKFLRALPGLAIHPMRPELAPQVDRMATELMRVDFQTPPGFSDLLFWPLGIPGVPSWPFRGRIDRLLIVSPFLESSALGRLGNLGKRSTLISREESLQALGSKSLAKFEEVYTLKPDANIDREGSEAKSMLTGLHAKLYLADSGSDARIWTGSANATSAAFASNVEILVEMTGARSRFGIDVLMERVQGEARFSDLLESYRLDETSEVPEDPAKRRLDEGFRTAVAILAKSALSANVEVIERQVQTYRLSVAAKTDILSTLAAGIEIWCRPVSIDESAYARVELRAGPCIARIPTIAADSLTPFFAFRIKITLDSRHSETRECVLTLPLTGDLPDRRSRAFQFVMNSKDRVLKYLLCLLEIEPQPGPPPPPEDGSGKGPNEEGPAARPAAPLLEALLHALDRDPERLDQVEDALRRLRGTEEARSRIPEGLERIWEPIWQARQKRRG